jgi:hypothetical protein
MIIVSAGHIKCRSLTRVSFKGEVGIPNGQTGQMFVKVGHPGNHADP